MVRPMVVLILVVAGVHPLGAQLTQELAVSRLRGVSIDDARVDEILKEVGDLLRTRDSPEDHQARFFFDPSARCKISTLLAPFSDPRTSRE